ncbi:hypothetical protein PCANC_11730 [Puccinia coronata f. sp. avenae]|uniref:Uncharacterized protein n=1 Tax=Puccinia coronata f. sp. avenae TaxID=200324 RepID=A0A2N5STF6_9BASI|nr:hypothetical protein PCASD_25413 [Puccinia coronata f. sp. avenae]PLW16538.1 hypothetical protein PCANC_11730 [Puccinia coronata f. sp. avenae]
MASTSSATSPAATAHTDHHCPSVCYTITTFESEIGKFCWEVKDLDGHLIFKSFKELTHDEIVEGIQDSSGETLWTIRRPIRGWYLVLRSPLDLNPQNFLALQPKNVTKGKNKRVEFTFRLKSSPCEKPVVNGHMRKDSTDSSMKRRKLSISSLPKSPNRLETAIDHHPPSSLKEALICLQPMEEDLKDQTFLKAFTNLFANNNQRFQCVAKPSSPTSTHLPCNNTQASSDDPLTLFDYEDQTSLFGIHNSGILKIRLKSSLEYQLVEGIDDTNQRELHCAFWVAVCIAYLGFRADQDAYIAANEDE